MVCCNDAEKKKKFHMLIFWMVLNLFDALPRAGIFLLEATSVAVDSRDNVYVFNRGNMPVLVFDTHGQYNSHELMPVLVFDTRGQCTAFTSHDMSLHVRH